MDPYLEARWSDVHARLIAYIGETLQPLLPHGLRARAEERVLLEEDEGAGRALRPDVAVIDTGRRGAASRAGEARQARTGRAAKGAAATTIEPVFIRFESGPHVDRSVQIIDVTTGNRVITAIEVLSPWNKAPGRLNVHYMRKLDTYVEGGVSVVEIDLLRGSRGRLRVDSVDLPLRRREAYLVCVLRAWAADRWEAYPIALRRPLPAVPIPLRRTDRDVPLELQPLIDRVYAGGGHDDIDYTAPPDPPLDPEDSEWAEKLLAAARRR